MHVNDEEMLVQFNSKNICDKNWEFIMNDAAGII